MTIQILHPCTKLFSGTLNNISLKRYIRYLNVNSKKLTLHPRNAHINSDRNPRGRNTRHVQFVHPDLVFKKYALSKVEKVLSNGSLFCWVIIGH